MKMRYTLGVLSLALLPTVAAAEIFGNEELPPPNAMPLSQIVQQVESRENFAAITEVEYEDDKYEIEYYDRNGEEQEVEIDVLTGEEV